MTKSVNFSQGHDTGNWGVVSFGNGASCTVDEGNTSIVVSRSTSSISSEIFYEASLSEANERRGVFDKVYTDDLTPAGMRPSILKSYLNVVMHCQDLAEVEFILTPTRPSKALDGRPTLQTKVEKNMWTLPISIIIAASLISLSIIGNGNIDRKTIQGKIDRCYSVSEQSMGRKFSAKQSELVMMDCEQKY